MCTCVCVCVCVCVILAVSICSGLKPCCAESAKFLITIILMTLKGAIPYFSPYDLLTTLLAVSNTYAHVARVQSCANLATHQVLIMCKVTTSY